MNRPPAGRRLLVGVLVVLVLGVLALLPVLATRRAATREIVLVARGMAFYLEGDSARPNPRIAVAPGEDVRLILRAEDPGLSHDLTVPAWGIATRPLKGIGTAALDVHVPDRPGEFPYVCTPHARMMNGIIEVRWSREARLRP